MKKRIYLILLFIVVIFFSCRDKTGQFEEQLFTDAQINIALQFCITIACDSTLNILCIVDTIQEKYGYYYYDSKNYRIALPAEAKPMIDTLVVYGFEASLDTLIFNINRASELCGNKIKADFCTPVLQKITFSNPNLILHGGDHAITDFAKETKQIEFISLLKTSILKEQFNTLDIIETWNSLQEEYYKLTAKLLSIDILETSTQQMVDGFFKHIAIVEEAVRHNPGLRGATNGWLYRVFATL